MAKWENTPGRGNAIRRQRNQRRNLEDSGQIKQVCMYHYNWQYTNN